MKPDDPRDKHAEINPARRHDQPEKPRENLAEGQPDAGKRPVKAYQEEPLDPVDQGGIAE